MTKRILVGLLLFFASCSPMTAKISEPTRDTVPSKTLAMPPTSNPTITPTFSVTAIPNQTWTPRPTFTYDEGIDMLKIWFAGTDNCLLPCWAGIIPGKTNWEDALYIIRPLESVIKLDAEVNVDCVHGKCSYISWSVIPTERGILSSIYPEQIIDYIMLETIDSDHMASLSLQNIFIKYGKPKILLFSTDPEQPGQKFLELLLVYPEMQFLIKYSKYAKLNGNNLESCEGDSYIKLVVLDNSEQLLSLDAIANSVETRDFHIGAWYKSAEDAVGMTIDTFFETFRKPNPPCIISPSSVWQP